jgi:hypothetical protein
VCERERGRERKAEKERERERRETKTQRESLEWTYILISFLLIFVICFKIQVQFSCFIMDRLHPLHPAWNMS